MIALEELRLGNLVIFRRFPTDNGEIRKVVGVNEEFVELKNPNCSSVSISITKDQIYPLPLFACDVIRELKNPQIKGMVIESESYRFDYYNNVIFDNNLQNKNYNIKYVHELQNYLFAYIREEITHTYNV